MAFDTRLLANLDVLAAVVQAGNFARAGKILGLSQPAVSRAVQRLEEGLGLRLFERSAKATRLTEEGSRFCEEMLPALRRIEEVVESTVRSGRQVRGRLRVNVEPAFGRLVLATRLESFLKAYPGLHLELIAQEQLGDLVADGFDAAIRFGREEPTSLTARKLFEVSVVTCAAPPYLQSHGQPRVPMDLVKQRHECLLLCNPATSQPYTWDFVRGRRRLPALPVTGRLLVNDAYTYREACLAGLGVAQLLHVGIDSFLKTGKLVELFPDWADECYPLWAYYPSRQFMPAKVQALLTFLETLPKEGIIR